ncbi:MAG TPA: zf-HC2 domain-containing protein [Kofleriaceae bacterium]|nr:zf-HC2 domain-containing protein [Kofleriaceae bacterium]
MKCADVDRLATAYVDGELDERRSSALRGHLRVCDACAARVEDEAAVRDAAAVLPSRLDPPADLWSAIDARLAQEEIGDAERPRIALWWQRVLDGARRYRIPLAFSGAAAAALVAVWLTRNPSTPTSTSTLTSTSTSTLTSTSTAPCGAVTYQDQVACEAAASDARYQQAMRDLETAVAAERGAWSAAEAARFDADLAALDRAVLDEQKRLAVEDVVSPADRDALHALYQDRLDLLSRAAIFGEPIARAP